MGKTYRGDKAPDHEYWSRRPFNRCGQSPGSFAKKRTHKAERQQVEAEIEEGMVELDDPNDEPCFICNGHHAWEPDEDDCEMAVINKLRNMGVDYD